MHQLEQLAEATSDAKVMVCDRGSIDGAVYWPYGADNFFTSMKSSLDAELARYDAVIHLSPPPEKDFYQATNVRTENLQQAFDIDDKILKSGKNTPTAWSFRARNIILKKRKSSKIL